MVFRYVTWDFKSNPNQFGSKSVWTVQHGSNDTCTNIFKSRFYILYLLNISGILWTDSLSVRSSEIFVFSKCQLKKRDENWMIITGVMNKKLLNQNQFQDAIVFT